MPGRPTFQSWARAKAKSLRSGLSASAAAWIAADRCWPARAKTLDSALIHLREHRPCNNAPDEVAVRALFEQYRAFLAAGKPLPRAPKAQNVHRGYLIPRKTEDQIKDIATARSQRLGRRVTLGDVIASAIDRDHRRECR